MEETRPVGGSIPLKCSSGTEELERQQSAFVRQTLPFFQQGEQSINAETNGMPLLPNPQYQNG